jgi:type I restriction enzyme R subunit
MVARQGRILKAAAKALIRYLELPPVNIEQVASVIVEHLRLTVTHEPGGRAMGMAVAASRLAAVKRKLIFECYIRVRG